MILCSKSHAQAASPLVILSGAKDLGFSPVSDEKRSEMFRFAQHDNMTRIVLGTFGQNRPMIHPKETRETLSPCDPKRAVQLATKGGEID